MSDLVNLLRRLLRTRVRVMAHRVRPDVVTVLMPGCDHPHYMAFGEDDAVLVVLSTEVAEKAKRIADAHGLPPRDVVERAVAAYAAGAPTP